MSIEARRVCAVIGLLLFACVLVLPARAAETSRRPNVIVILADDLGYGDTSAYGSQIIKTPTIDRLAVDGVRFTAGYVTHPACAPSRAALITGRYQERFGYEFNPAGRDRTGGVSLDEITLAQILRSSGYATGMVGKWHLGQATGFYPSDRGFDSYFGMAGGGSGYIVDPRPGDEFFTSRWEGGGAMAADEVQGEALRRRLNRARQAGPITRDRQEVQVTEYLTDRFTEEAVAFIDNHKNEPFFLYLAYNAPHAPLQATKKYLDRYKDVQRKSTRIYAAMVSALDDGVGAVRAKLEAEGLETDTIVFFLSDNGCASYLDGQCSNAPLSGFKGEHLEGGIRIPYIVAWPGHIAGGRVDDRQVSTLDVVPTAAALAGASLPADRPYDGVDLLPYLMGVKADSPHPVLYWRAGVNYAIRDGNWKMWIANRAPHSVKVNPQAEDFRVEEPLALPTDAKAKIGPDGQVVMLYDLSKDLGETTNLATTRGAVVDHLRTELSSWDAMMVKPQWTSLRQSYVYHRGEVLQLFD